MSVDVVPQVKICGLTNAREALGCVELGARAIGFVFYPQSPRYVPQELAGSIYRDLPSWVSPVGVFVDEGFSQIMRKVEACGLKAVQLHGKEPPQLVERLMGERIKVIKAVFVNGLPPLASSKSYPAFALLVESAGGILPGGNALSWNWDAAAGVRETHRLVLAGGLTPENVAEAIAAASPDAVDVSSGVESEPGKKDLEKVRRFMDAVALNRVTYEIRSVF